MEIPASVAARAREVTVGPMGRRYPATVRMPSILTPVLVAFSLLPCTAQEESDPLFDVEWHVLEDGSLGITPSPSSGGAPGVIDPLFRGLHADPSLWGRIRFSLQRDPYTWLVLLAPGARDVASTTWAELDLAARGFADAAARIALLDGVIAERPHGDGEFLQLLAIRAASRSGVRTVREPIQRFASRDGLADGLRRAAKEALADLGGRPLDEPPHLPPVSKERLVDLPSDSAVVIRIESLRLPPMDRLATAFRALSLRTTRYWIRQAGGGPATPPMLAGGQFIADWPCLLGHELARRFGSWRVHRSVTAIGTHFDVRLFGDFDPDAVAAGCDRETPRVAFQRGKGGAVIVDLPDEYEWKVEHDRMRLWNSKPRVASPGGRDLADALDAAGVRDDDVLWIHRRSGVPWPECLSRNDVLAWLRGFESCTVRVALDDGIDLRLVGDVAAAELEGVRANVQLIADWLEDEGFGELDVAVSGESRMSIRYRKDAPVVETLVAMIGAIEVWPGF